MESYRYFFLIIFKEDLTKKDKIFGKIWKIENKGAYVSIINNKNNLDEDKNDYGNKIENELDNFENLWYIDIKKIIKNNKFLIKKVKTFSTSSLFFLNEGTYENFGDQKEDSKPGIHRRISVGDVEINLKKFDYVENKKVMFF